MDCKEIQTLFSLKDYVSKIKLEENTLLHLADTEETFYQYLKKLFLYDKYAMLVF